MDPSYKVALPKWFLFVSILSTILVGFLAGQFARLVLMDVATSWTLSQYLIDKDMKIDFDPSLQITNSLRDSEEERRICSEESETCEDGERQNSKILNDSKGAGRHAIVDIENVNHEFLISEDRLLRAMMGVISEFNANLLSYHCHTLPVGNGGGVTCVGVLSESVISLNTFPEVNTVCLDFHTRAEEDIFPLVKLLKDYFGVKTDEGEVNVFESPYPAWAYKARGFGMDEEDKGPVEFRTDLGTLLRRLDGSKDELVSIRTPFQRIDIYSYLEFQFTNLTQYYKSLQNDSSYESRNAKYYDPNVEVFLDGVLQSTKDGDEPYHEALVHPAMFSHSNPRRVAIIGGGECATLREVLKHSTVEHVKMIEIDEMMVKVSREYIGKWSDCSDLVGSADWCGDDERVDLVYDDALEWFINEFGDATDEDDDDEDDDDDDDDDDLFDIIIMDALDPQDDVEFADALYNANTFIQSLYNGLSENGVIAMQLGEAPTFEDPPDEVGFDRKRDKLISILVEVGFKSFHFFDEGHGDFLDAWTYLVAFKSFENRANWYASTAELDLAIHKRILPTHSGNPALQYFDGATMKSFQVPHRAFETVYCRKRPKPVDCVDYITYDSDAPHIPASSFEVKQSTLGEASGRGVFAKVDILEGSLIAPADGRDAVIFMPCSVKALHVLLAVAYREAGLLEYVYEYMDGYGFQSLLWGGRDYVVDSGILTFVNHGCNATYNIAGEELVKLNEMTIDTSSIPDHYGKKSYEGFRPALNRHLRHTRTSADIALRNISAGEEIFSNYLEYIGVEKDWARGVRDLREQCLGMKVGYVMRTEQEYNSGR